MATATAITASTTAERMTTKAYTHSGHVENETVFLKPRPFARLAGCFVLVPLLPKRPPLKPLPAEVWRKVMMLAIIDEVDTEGASYLRSATVGKPTGKNKERERFKWDLALVCKEFKALALPLLYADCQLPTLGALDRFTAHLHAADQKWDSIRRIPYSTPGRWVQSLDLSPLVITCRADACAADAHLTVLFPLLPFLASLELSLALQLSRRAMAALALRDGAQHLRALKGVKYDSGPARPGEDDPLSELVSCCVGLEELEVVGPGMDDLALMIAADGALQAPPTGAQDVDPPVRALALPRLRTLTLLSTPASDLLLRLVHSPLPALRHVVLTPYGDIAPPLSRVAEFLAAHGRAVRSLVLHTPNSWPTVLYPPPAALLQGLPHLTALSLESARFAVDVPPSYALARSPTSASCDRPSRSGHPLEVLWVPRPTPDFRESLARLLPHLPNLREVRARDVRWAKRGISARALEAGFQGEMRAWRRWLASRGIKMLDADGREGGA